jgi:N-sulfoglucosamine sulfohydrolase
MSILFKKLFLNRTVSILILSLLFSCKFSKKPIDDNTTPIPKTTNILWLVTEDMGQYLPSFGDNTVLTPNLNRLAAEGIKYPNVFSPSGVCAPSRAAISTGMYPSSIGANHMRTTSYTEVTGLPKYEAIPPPEVKMFSELLRKQGYYCTNNAKNDYQFKAPVTSWDQNGKKAHWKNRAQGNP